MAFTELTEKQPRQTLQSKAGHGTAAQATLWCGRPTGSQELAARTGASGSPERACFCLGREGSLPLGVSAQETVAPPLPPAQWHQERAGRGQESAQTPLAKQNQTDTETSKSREATVGINPGVRFQAKRNQHSRHMSCTSCGQPGPGPGGRRGNPGTEGHCLCPGGAREQVPCPPVTEEPPLPVVGSGSWGREWALTPHSAAARANVL